MFVEFREFLVVYTRYNEVSERSSKAYKYYAYRSQSSIIIHIFYYESFIIVHSEHGRSQSINRPTNRTSNRLPRF